MCTELSIRPASKRDSADLLVLLDTQNAFHAAHLPSFFERGDTVEDRILRVFEDPDAERLVADDHERLHGGVELRLAETKPLPILVRKRFAYIQKLIALEGFREKEIGTALLEAARAWAQARGVHPLRTSVAPGNERAGAFCAKQGFPETMISIETALEQTS